MSDSSKRCQYYYPDLKKATLPDTRLALKLRSYWWMIKRNVWYISISSTRTHTSVIGCSEFVQRVIPSVKLRRYILKKKSKAHQHLQNSQNLNLRPGEWVEVRSAKEIFATLDVRGKLRGLSFTREMVEFCGRRFRVYKVLKKIILEATGELRTIKSPTVLLEGVFCDGKFHGGCDRSCFCFWREDWLKRSPSKD